MFARIVDFVMSRRRPDMHGPGFFTWHVFNRNWVAFSLRYDDDGGRPGAPLPCVPVSFRFFVVSGEVLIRTLEDLDGDVLHTFYDQNSGDMLAVYSVKAGQSFYVPAGAPLKLELVPTSIDGAHETWFPKWMLPNEAKLVRRKPARMVVLRSLLTRVR